MNTPVFFESAGDERGTPAEFFAQLDAEFHFDLDAAASAENHKCELYFGKGGVEEDALTADWGGKGASVFLNPPYSIAGRFIAKAREEANKGATVVMLLPVRSDTKWWHDSIWDKTSRTSTPGLPEGEPDGDWRAGVRGRFLPGRLTFELTVPPELRLWISDEHEAFKAAQEGRWTVESVQYKHWLSTMVSVTGLPRMSVERILQNLPDNELLDGAPFPSCVVIFGPVSS